MYQVIPLPSNKISGSTEDPTATPQDTPRVIYSFPKKPAPVSEKPVPASLEDTSPIYHVPDKPKEEPMLHSNEISIDAEAPPVPPFLYEESMKVSSLETLL